METRPFRSVLYIPASKSRALDKAAGLPVDAIIFDLEDAVAVAEKAAARRLLAETLMTTDYGPRARLVRINDLSGEWGARDLEILGETRPEAILLPKVDDTAQIEALARKLDARPETADTRIWAMMETPRGVQNAARIAAGPRMAGFVLGTNDLAKELCARFRPDRLPLMHALQSCLYAARAQGLVAVDGVFNAFRDVDGLRAECEQGRDLGFDGKSLIHPAQVETANEVFAPAGEDLELARRQILAWDEAQARGEGVAVVDGRIVENLHIEIARRQIARAEAIQRLKETM
jgi:(3S)-malyl-CoA thioesterase